MSNAFATHDGPLLLIGTDCPVLETGHLVSAVSALREGHDAVFIPAEDGGGHACRATMPATPPV